MLKFNLNTAKSLFFDRTAVINRLTKAEVKVLSRFGSFVRTAAQRSMRSGGKKGIHSKPGEPPRTHGQRLLRKLLLFAYDDSRKSVVIGPTLLDRAANRNYGKTVPETLEYGGFVEVAEAQKADGSWSRSAMRWAAANKAATRRRKARIEPRPYMAPAYAKEKPKLMGLWKDAMDRV